MWKTNQLKYANFYWATKILLGIDHQLLLHGSYKKGNTLLLHGSVQV